MGENSLVRAFIAASCCVVACSLQPAACSRRLWSKVSFPSHQELLSQRRLRARLPSAGTTAGNKRHGRNLAESTDEL